VVTEYFDWQIKRKENNMAQFRAECKGGGNAVSRLGHKTTGISSHTCGWESGIKVEGYHDEDLGDIFMIYQTSGSGFKKASVLLGKLVGESFTAIENT
jgi:hypothetical protein